jgi:CHAT domain-containing protein
VLIVADPVYSADDPRLAMMATSDIHPSEVPRPSILYRGSGESPSLARLDSSAREARQIRALFDPRQVDLLEGLQATRDELVTRNLASYRVIHIASHGWIDAEIPQLSALILGSYGMHGAVADPYFRAGDFLGRTLEAEAVVLSACDTALGAESTGEGLVGLRYAALARGAHSVVASLWPVSDGIAADLMTGMYRELTAAQDTGEQGPATTVAERVALSLTGAVRQLLQRSPEIDPALWAAFTVYVAGD